MKPVFLIGAARSGTKLLRDSLALHEDIGATPFDANFVWKRYHANIPHDRLMPDNRTSRTRAFVAKYLNKWSDGRPFVIEKTVSNSVRVKFVDELFPESKFIHLIRDGRDVVASELRQWGKVPDSGYLLKKLRAVPVIETMPYVIRYGIDTLKIKLRGKPDDEYVWGVKFPRFEEPLKTLPVYEFCALQWKHCINYAVEDFNGISNDRICTVKYEDLVREPEQTLQSILRFIGAEPQNLSVDHISDTNVGSHLSHLKEDESERVETIIKEELIKFNYNK